MGKKLATTAIIVEAAEVAEAIKKGISQGHRMHTINSHSNLDSNEFFVQYHVTHRCNLSCSHCYQKNYFSDNELSFSDISHSLKEISNMVLDWRNRYCKSLTGTIQLTGGEPLVKAQWQDIIDFCLDNSLTVILMTNGTLLTKDIAEFLADRDINVQISLDGMENTHDKIRGHKAYQKTMNGISFLQNANVNFSVNFTLMKDNLDDLPGFIEEIKNKGIFRLGISRYLPKKDKDEQTLEKKQLKKAYTFIQQQTNDELKITSRDPLFSLLSSDEISASDMCLSGCSIGFFGFCILHNGDIVPCSRLNLPIGNIKIDSIRDVWANSELLWKFRNFETLNEKCLNCSYKNICRGCRAVSYATSGDCFSEDPQCWISD